MGNYVAEVTDNAGCVVTESFSIGSTTPNVGCTDPNATNYDPSAICDCACCEVAGCLDPNATNYNPNANIGAQCEYVIEPNPCIPEQLETDRRNTHICLILKGTDWLRDYKIGRTEECSLMDQWKLILISYLLDQDGLSCLFNCADLRTPIPRDISLKISHI